MCQYIYYFTKLLFKSIKEEECTYIIFKNNIITFIDTLFMDLNYHLWSSVSSLKNFLHISYNGRSANNKAYFVFYFIFFNLRMSLFCLQL